MDLRTYIRILRKNLLLITALVILGGTLGFLAFRVTPPTFASTVTFYVSTPLPEGSNAQSAGQFAENRVNSYVELLHSEELGRRVQQVTDTSLSPGQIAQRISGSAQVNTVLVTATVSDSSGQRSLLIARGVAESFPDMVAHLDNQGGDTAVVVINVVSGPTLHSAPVSPDVRKYTGLGIVAGLVIAVMIALGRALFDTTIRTEKAAEEHGRVPVIGTIPFDGGAQRAPLIIGPAGRSPRAEAFRHFRTNLQFIDAARDSKVLLITSALPGEGKTLTAANLAVSFAELGDSVLLIEADMRRPHLSEYLDLSSEVGLSNVLAGQVVIEEVTQPWGDGKLSVLSSGSTPPNPSELLGSTRMVNLLKLLRDRYDRIVIDCAPVLAVSDALVASAAVDAVVLVIRSGRTHNSQADQAAHSLQAVHAPLVGSVLSMHKGDRLDSVRYRGRYD